jgi:hypothetical protein
MLAGAAWAATARADVRINSGGEAYTSSSGDTYTADGHFSGSTFVGSTSANISGTQDAALYQTERVGIGSFKYSVPVPPGTYQLRLHFAEWYWGAVRPGGPGSRVFSVDIEETPASPDIANLDVYAEAGPRQALVKTIDNIVVTDGTVDIDFLQGPADLPKVDAIEVIAENTPAPAPPWPAPPAAPQDYSLPSSYVSVATSQELVDALARTSSQNIVLADGSYTTVGTTSATSYFLAAAGHRLYARDRGSAVLQAGLVFGGNYGSGGGEVHGLAFDIIDPALSFHSSALNTWGARGVGTKIYDSTFEGHAALKSAIRADVVTGLVVERVVVRHFRHYGVFESDNNPDSTAAATTISDLDIASIKEPIPGTNNGRSEYGLWLGNSVRDPVARVHIRDFGWAGLWTGNNANDLDVRDFDIDGSARPDGNAVYIEHTTRRTVFERFHLGPDISEGFVSEWDYGTDPTGAGIDNTVQDGVIDTNKAGVANRFGILADAGTLRMTIQRVSFMHPDRACVIDRGTDTIILDIDCPLTTTLHAASNMHASAASESSLTLAWNAPNVIDVVG